MNKNAIDEGERIKKENESERDKKEVKELQIKKETEEEKQESGNSNLSSAVEGSEKEVGRYGSKKAIIESYKILNCENNETINLETGKEFSVELQVAFKNDISNPTFGVMFRKNPNENLFGLHSLYSENPVQILCVKSGQNCFIKMSDKLILTPAVYFLSFYITSQETYSKWELLDSFENTIRVNVIGSKDYWGIVNSGQLKVDLNIT